MDLPTSSEDVRKIAGEPVRVEVYPDITRLRHIEQLVGADKPTILLYSQTPTYGHWVALLRYANTVEFFDPYGGMVDTPLEFAGARFRAKNDMTYPHILRMLYEWPGKTEYNDVPWQRVSPRVSTCGRWCGLRCRFRHLSLEEFNRFIRDGQRFFGVKDPDEYVTRVSYAYLSLPGLRGEQR